MRYSVPLHAERTGLVRFGHRDRLLGSDDLVRAELLLVAAVLHDLVVRARRRQELRHLAGVLRPPLERALQRVVRGLELDELRLDLCLSYLRLRSLFRGPRLQRQRIVAPGAAMIVRVVGRRRGQQPALIMTRFKCRSSACCLPSFSSDSKVQDASPRGGRCRRGASRAPRRRA